MADGFHPPLEEYLEAIWELEEEGVEVIQARLAEHVGHSAPSVSETVRRLRADGYIGVKGRRLTLTEKGRERAVGVVRKHRLAERLLTDVVGLEPEYVHEEACRWEHVISDRVEHKLAELLGNPTTSPYGNPIPGGHDADHEVRSLADADGSVRIEWLSELLQGDHEVMTTLEAHGIRSGQTVAVVSVPGGVVVTVDGTDLPLSHASAKLVYVSPA